MKLGNFLPPMCLGTIALLLAIFISSAESAPGIGKIFGFSRSDSKNDTAQVNVTTTIKPSVSGQKSVNSTLILNGTSITPPKDTIGSRTSIDGSKPSSPTSGSKPFDKPSSVPASGAKPFDKPSSPSASSVKKTFKMDPAFKTAGREVGLEIWRIENFQAVPYDKTKYGTFHSGDSYIILNTRKEGDKLAWDLHFWLGNETSQDEQGTAAIKTVELDDQLGGVPVQYRETQDFESKQFLSYFKKGVRYLPGGIASGFKHVDPDHFEKRMYQVKGRRNIRVREVEPNISSMNKGDCFILDMGKVLWVYCGPESRRVERLKATIAANEIRDEDHAGDAKVIIADESSGQYDKFFSELGHGSPKEVANAVDDTAFELSEATKASLHRVSDNNDPTKEIYTVKIAEKPLKQDMLITGDCFILDTGSSVSGVYVWIGKNSTKAEKAKAMELAGKYVRLEGYPSSTRISRIVEGGETAAFKQYFSQWKEPDTAIGFGHTISKGQIAASLPDRDFDVNSLHAEKRRQLSKSGGSAFGFQPDDGNGTVEIYRVENFQLVKIDDKTKGMFFGGDSYVLNYTYKKETGGHGYIVYFWLGNNSTQDEKAAAAVHAVKLDEAVGGKAIQVRVTQGNEPQHFLKIFKGRMVVLMGGHASGFKNMHDHDTYDLDGTRLFRVRGTSVNDVRAEQVEEKSKSLSSDDVFVLETPTVTYVWSGTKCDDFERQMGMNVSRIVSPGRKVEAIAEGKEPDAFWKSLGGKTDYKKTSVPEKPLLEPRLFHVFLSGTGKLRVEEIGDFEQSDLNVDDCMVLDTGSEIYVWVGSGADATEKEKAFTMATTYLKSDPTDRTKNDTLIIQIKQGGEPAGFKAMFKKWNDNLWAKRPTLDEFRPTKKN